MPFQLKAEILDKIKIGTIPKKGTIIKMRKMKKNLIAVALVLCVATIGFGAALANEEPEPSDKTTESSSEIIPIHGYVGPFSEVVTPDPDPDRVTEIYVSVPVKIIFAAFDIDNGEISSPVYKITNLSKTTDLKIEIESFTQNNDEDAPLNGQMNLKLVNQENEDLVAELFPSDYTNKKLMTDMLPKNVDSENHHIFNFMIGGRWDGDFDTKVSPIFDMTIKFSAAQ